MKTRTLLLIMFLFCAMYGIGQDLRNGQVVGTIPVGNQVYSVIHESGTENHFKTSPHAETELRQGQNVQLQFNGNNSNQAQVTAETLQSNLFCHLIQPNGDNNPLLQLLGAMPVLENEILFFEDTSHIRIFYDLLTTVIDESNLEMDEMLDLAEAQFSGYESYRTWFNREYNWLDGSFTIDEIERISNIDFINDEIHKTMINKDGFIGLQDSIYYFHSENVSIGIHKDNDRMISILQGLDQNYDVFGPGSVIFPYLDEVRLISDVKYSNDPKGTFIVNPNLEYISWPMTEIVNCDPKTKKLRLQLIEDYTDASGYNSIDNGYIFNANANATLTIDWDDGNIEVINNYAGEWVEHTFVNNGTYYPTTTLEFDDRNGDPGSIEDGTNTQDGEPIKFIVEYACTNQNTSDYGSMISGEWMLTTKLWVKWHIIFWNQIGSYSHCWKQNGDGSWSRHKADLYAKAAGVFRGSNDCTNASNKVGEKLRHSKKKVQKTKSKWRKHYFRNGEVGSRGYMVKGSTFLEIILLLTPC